MVASAAAGVIVLAILLTTPKHPIALIRVVDSAGRPKDVTKVNDPTAGSNLWLTIDSDLQTAAENALIEGVQKANMDPAFPAAGGAVVKKLPINQIVAYNVNGFHVWYQLQDGSWTRNPTDLSLIDEVVPSVLTRVTATRMPSMSTSSRPPPIARRVPRR